jgi:signal transduction histidine kinase
MLIKNYILFTINITVIIFIVMFIGLFKVLGLASRMSQNDEMNSQIPLLEKGQYQDIDTSSLEKQNGWIEIIDENYKVIHSKGNIKEKRDSYTKTELEAITNPESIPYEIQKYDFKNKTGENLILISKIPKQTTETDNITKYIEKSFSQLFMIFMGLYIFNIMFFILWMNKKVKKPLDKINRAMNLFAEKNEEIYIDYKGENEFVQICNSFNDMVKKLKTMEKEKKVLEESRQKMLANISHDLKTPITIVQGYAKAISEGYVTDVNEINKYLNIIYKKSNKVTEIINLLFEYVKLGHPDFKLNLILDDLSEFIREIIAENYEHIDDCGFILEFSVPEEKFLYNFDKNQLKRAISNLISNSLKYNEPGTIISVTLGHTESYYVITVADNGVGIPGHVKEELFVPFVIGDKSRNINGGTGLGLSIAKQIIDKHGGEINLISSSGSEFSTLFEIKLPRIIQ